MEKYTYIKFDVEGYYIEFDEMFNPELYDNLGSTYEDFLNYKWVLLSDEQVQFRIDHPNASVSEVWNMQLIPEPERTIDDARHEMIERIEEYDKSDNVNGFTVNGEIEGWFTADERSNYRSSIDAAKLLEIDSLSFYIGDTLFEINPNDAEYMLARIQLYADQCYMVTKEHKLAVEALDTIEKIYAFDYTADYPDKLNFTFPIDNELEAK